MNITIADFGGSQEEAVGMAAVAVPAIFLDAALPIAVPGGGAINIASILAGLFIDVTGAGVIATDIISMLVIIEGTQSLNEAVGMAAAYDQSLDTGFGIDAVVMTAAIPVTFSGAGLTAGDIIASVQIAALGLGTDYASAAKAYFFITSEGVINPLGVLVLRDSRHDLLPSTRDAVTAVPGRHGVYDFGTEFNERYIEIKAASKGHIDVAQRAQIKRTLAKYLNPLVGKQPLIFAEDIEKTYMIRYTGQIDMSIFKSWLEFTIPFTGEPIIIGSFEKQHIGSGTLINEGTYEAPLIIRIAGAGTNPSVIVGDKTLTWVGVLGMTDVLEINTEHMTVRCNGINALAGYTGGFPQIQPGETAVTAATAQTTWLWRDRWI